MKRIDVYPPGARVLVADGEVEGVVSGVAIRAGGHVEYQVEHWSGGSYNSTWLDTQSVEAKNGDRMAVGFK